MSDVLIAVVLLLLAEVVQRLHPQVGVLGAVAHARVEHARIVALVHVILEYALMHAVLLEQEQHARLEVVQLAHGQRQIRVVGGLLAAQKVERSLLFGSHKRCAAAAAVARRRRTQRLHRLRVGFNVQLEQRVRDDDRVAQVVLQTKNTLFVCLFVYFVDAAIE